MNPTRTGTIQAWVDAQGKKHHRARIRLRDGSRPWLPIPDGCTEARAREIAAALQEQEDAKGALYAAKKERELIAARAAGTACEGETADAWHERFRATRGEGPTSNARYNWRKWVSPVIGSVAMVAVSKEDIERIRDSLDAAVRAHAELGRGHGRLSSKSALDIWSTVTTAFKQAARAKDKGLRVRSDNPCTDVLPPERGESRRKPYIYPREFLLLMGCEAIPVAWRALYAVAAYLYLRPAELFELRWSDIDLDVGLVSITRAWDWQARSVKAPKTRNGVRTIPIPEALVPLLKAMGKGKRPDEKVVPILEKTGKLESAAMLRRHLLAAGVSHPRLFQDTATHMPVGFRSWRDTGITWLAIDGVDVAKIQRRAGHDSIETTMGYVKAAEDISGAAGTPFPPLPPELLRSIERSTETPSPRNSRAIVVAPPGLEPRRLFGPEVLSLLRIPFRQGAVRRARPIVPTHRAQSRNPERPFAARRRAAAR